MIEENQNEKDGTEQQQLQQTEESLNQKDTPLFGRKEESSLSVKLTAYEGPLDLLLDLIKKNEINIYDIPMIEITKQYLDYIDQMRQMDLDIAGDFLVMASTLLYIKSKMLLPEDDQDDDDEDGLDPRAELVRKLLEYQAFKEAAKELGIREAERNQIFTRQISDYYFGEDYKAPEVEEEFDADLYDLIQAFHHVLKTHSKEDVQHEVFEEVVSIEQKMDYIKDLIIEKKEVLFSELFRGPASKNEIIATFLALLEIVKQKHVRVAQAGMFGEIKLVRKQLNTIA